MIKVTKSPLKTHAFDPNTLPIPKPTHSLTKTLLPVGKRKGFETIKEAREEDRKRAGWLIKAADPKAHRLGHWLNEATKTRLLPLSPASSFYMRMCRRKILGAVHLSLHRHGYADADFTAYTLIHPKWFFDAGNLHNADPKKLRKQLRRWLEQAGVIAADGLFFAVLHGCFDGVGYQLHYHGIVSGEKIEKLKAMSGRFGFTPTADIDQPIEIEAVTDMPGWLSYCMKPYWTQQLWYIDRNGERKRQRKKSRIKHPHHEEVLMWMSKQHLFSLIIHSGFSSSPWGRLGNGKL